MQAPRTPLAGRYRFVGPFEPRVGPLRWLAGDDRTGKPVVVAQIAVDRVATFQGLLDQRHPHLATVVDVVVEPARDHLPDAQLLVAGEALVVAEFVRGRTLHQQLGVDGALAPFKAVAWLLRLISAVEFLHERGVVHAGLSPRSVIADPQGRVIAPVVTHFVAPAVGVYATPERLKGAPVGREDDRWALVATFYAMLVGAPPVRAATREQLVSRILAGSVRALADFGLEEPLLQEVLSRGLHPSLRQRVGDLTYLTQVLEAWERGVEPPSTPVHVGAPLSSRPAHAAPSAPERLEREGLVCDEGILADDNGVPPLPERTPVRSAGWSVSSAPAAAGTGGAPAMVVQAARAPAVGPRRDAEVPPFVRERRRWPYALLGIGLLGATAGILLVLLQSAAPTHSSPPPSANRALSTASTGGGADSEQLRQQLANPSEIRADCLRSYFPEAAFPNRPELDFVCGEEDFAAVARRLHALADPAAGGDAGSTPVASAAPTALEGGGLRVRVATRRLLASLDWYEVLTAAIIRSACCPQAPLVKLPATRGECPQLQGIVREIADASQKGVDVSHATKQFDEAIRCLFANGIDRPYAYSQPPDDSHRHAFQKFLQRAVELEAHRTKSRR